LAARIAMRKTAPARTFRALCRLARTLLDIHRKLHRPTQRSTAMKFETVMLQGFFAACLVICVTAISAMLA